MRRAIQVSGVLALVLVICLPGPVAWADDEGPTEKPGSERDQALAEAAALNSRVFQLWKAGRYREAEPLARKALRLREEHLGPKHPDVALSLLNLAAQLKGLGRLAEARPLYERSIRIYEKAHGPEHPQVASGLDSLAQLLRALARYEEARPLYERALRIREEALGPDHPLVAKSLNNLALLCQSTGRYQEARRRLERAIAIGERVFGAEHLNLSWSLSNLAVVLGDLGLFQESLALWERALAIQEKALSPEHPGVVKSLVGLAGLLRLHGEYDRARPLLERGLRIHEAAFGPDHVKLAGTLTALAILEQDMGNHEEAQALHERALEIRQKVLGPDHPDVAAGLVGLGRLLSAMGKYDEAEPLLERGLRIREQSLGPAHPSLAGSLNDLAKLYADTGRYEAALPLYERALRLLETGLGPEHLAVASTLSRLASLHLDLGLNEEARPLLEQSLEIHEKVLGRESARTAVVLHSLAMLLTHQAQYEQARLLYERALAIQENTYGEDHRDVAMTLTNLARLHAAAGHHDLAWPLCVRGLRIQERVLGPDHPHVASSLCTQADLLMAVGRHTEAMPLLERALGTYERTLGAEHPRTASVLHDLALAHWRMEQDAQALRLCQRAFRILRDALGPEHCRVAWTLHSLALLFADQGRYEEAGAHIEQCLSILDRCLRRNFVGLQTSDRLTMAQALRYWVDTSLLLGPHLERTGYEDLLRFKGLVARAGAAERRLFRQGGEEVASRTAELRAAERRLAQLANAVPSAFPPEGREARRKSWQEAYAKASAEREALALALARSFAPLRAGMERLDLDLDDIRTHLGAGEALVDFYRSGGRYLAWLVPSEGPVRRYDLGPAEAVEAAAADFGRLTGDRKTTSTDAGWRKAGRTLRDLVFAPLAEDLGEDVRTLYVCPDAALAAVPFAALPGRAEGRLLIDDFLVVLISMAQDQVPRAKGAAVAHGALVVGDVDYGAAAEETEQPVVPGPAPVASVDRAPPAPEFVRLPQTRAETEYVKRMLEEGCQVLIGREATEGRFRTAAKGRRILHLATHGFVRDDLMPDLGRRTPTTGWLGADEERQLAVGYDPMLLAGLALAGANPRRGGHGDDGILTAVEASFLDLEGTELVVLSACGTAGGKAEAGEGVIGLVQGFQMAGAKRVIASLWQVDDAATRLLMERLYEGMLREKDPLSPAQALRQAALAVRGAKDAAGGALAAPRNWAGFVCYGR